MDITLIQITPSRARVFYHPGLFPAANTPAEAALQSTLSPGHTAGSAVFVANDVLFIGDSADVTADGEIQGAPWIFGDSQQDNRACLSRLAQRLTRENVAIKAIVPAHSGPVEGLAPLVAFAAAN